MRDLSPAAEMIVRFLRAVEAREIEVAEKMMVKGALIVFPNGKVFANQRAMVDVAKDRYQWIKKTFDKIDDFESSDGSHVVYVMGTLYGCNRYGIEFNNIRYIDRFTLRNGLIVSQEVWNDLSASGVLELQPES